MAMTPPEDDDTLHRTLSSTDAVVPSHDPEKAAPPSESDVDWEVQWAVGDAGNPRNLPRWRKWLCTFVVSSASLCVTCTSSIYTSTYTQLRQEFAIAQLTAVAGLSLFVMGLGTGPMILAPLSEFYGRRPIYLVSFSCFGLLLLPCALAPNIGVLLTFRFLTGMAGSAFLSVAGGTVGDMFSGREMGAPMMIYTASLFLGPEVGPLVGGFINQHIHWRWTFWVVIIWSGVELLLLLLFVPETYTPVLLRQRAVEMRERTGEQRYFAPLEKMERSIPHTIAWSCARPFQLLATEAMLTLLCVFTAILLGVLYLFFQAFPLLFGAVHGFDLQTVGFTFLGLFVGMVIGIVSDPLWGALRMWLISREKDGKSQPEFRLPAGILGGVLVPAGLFWFAFTTSPGFHWIVPILGSALFAAGMLLVFSAVFTFLVDAYPLYAASALAANGFVRSVFAAGFPLFSVALYQRLGFAWGGALLAFLTVGMAPGMAAVFWWGKKIRRRSRFARGE